MKWSIFRRGGYGQGVIDTGGGETFGKVILFRDPELDMEAATRKYTDESTSNIHAGSFSEGLLPLAAIPEFKGDITKPVGSSELNLTPTQVIPGTYTKVTVDAKGRVTLGSFLKESDLPLIPFSSLRNTPTTLAGYNIADAISENGGVLTGKIQVPVMGTSPNSLVNKKYVDEDLRAMAEGVKPGTITLKAGDGPFEGFVKCNGAVLPVAGNEILYNAIGDRYTYRGTPGNGRPWEQQAAFNDGSYTNSLWDDGGSALHSLKGSQVVATKNKVWSIGGLDETDTPVTHITFSEIDENGYLGIWVTHSVSLPVALAWHQCIVTHNWLYVLGGTTPTGQTASVYRAPIDAEGVIGAFQVHGGLPVAVSNSKAVITNGRIYLVGGTNSSNAETNSVYTCQIQPNGALGNWYTDNPLPMNLANHSLVVMNNKMYVLGGRFSGNSYLSTIYHTEVYPNGTLGIWNISSIGLPKSLAYASVLVTASGFWLIGGRENNTEHSKSVHVGKVDLDGELIGWETSFVPNLYNETSGSSLVSTGRFVYLIGGGEAVAGKQISYLHLEGGANDYSKYYDGSLVGVQQDTFLVPDMAPMNDSDFYIAL